MTEQNSKTRHRFGVILILPVVVISVVTLCFLAGILYSLPERAEELYGPAAADLGIRKTYYYSLVLILGRDQLTSRSDLLEQPQEVVIESGESPTDIIPRLQQAGLLEYPDLFRIYLVYSGIDRQIQSGTYLLSSSQSALEIADQLRGPGPEQTIISVLPGWRAEEIAETFPEAGLATKPDEFLVEVSRRNLEGFLYPDQYEVKRTISAVDLVDQMYQNFLDQISAELENAWTGQGLSVKEAVILASIIEREAVVAEEKTLIASVFYNRMGTDMTLSADPTVQYAVGYDPSRGGWWPSPLTGEDLNNPSPYNTYLYRGLPPGPICNPGMESLRAVANPAETSFYFFRSACDGSGNHLFSETYQQHLDNACKSE